jgi:hypothetical protein
MIFLVYSTESDRTIANRLGMADYSYFFVMKLFLPVLERLGQVKIVNDPDLCKTRQDAVLLSFTPPQRVPQGIPCPTLPVFAWEYSSIPYESWGNEPRHNWAAVLAALPAAITHSHYAATAIQASLGADYPVASLPAPLWDEYATLYDDTWLAARHLDWRIDLPQGVILDSHVLGLAGETNTPAAPPAFEAGPCSVSLGGVVYTAVFNPNDGRKNWHDLLSAFCFAFREQADATLLLKLAYHDAQHACTLVWHEMKKLAPYRCRIVAVHGFLDAGTYRHVVAHSSFVVNTAHGEGQCLPLMEFMSAGKPAIAPNHTAMADYITPDNAFVVRSSEEWTHWPHDPRLVLRAFRYRIDWQSLHDAYLTSWRVIHDDSPRYRRMAQAAHEAQRQHCSQEVIARHLGDFLRRLGHRPARWPALRQFLNRARLRLQRAGQGN